MLMPIYTLASSNILKTVFKRLEQYMAHFLWSSLANFGCHGLSGLLFVHGLMKGLC